MELIITERLQLKKLSIEDAPFMFTLFNSPGWLKFIGDRGITSIEKAINFINEKYIPSYELHGYGSFVIVLKDTNEFIGTCGFYKRENLDYPDIGFAILPQYYRNGYAFEACTKLLELAEKKLHFKKILAITDKENQASIKLLEKIGLINSGTYTTIENKEELLLFSKDL
jgi:ribosomal-protein-alanine N-acetyltransferase